MRLLYLLLFACLISQFCHAQHTPFSSKAIPNPHQLKTAKTAFKTAQKHFNAIPCAYEKALAHGLIAQKINPNHTHLNLLLGKCFLFSKTSHDYKRATIHFQKVLMLSKEPTAEIHQLLGKAQHFNLEWDLAIAHFESALQLLTPKKDAVQIEELQQEIQECINGKALATTKNHLKVRNLGTNINSRYADYGAVFNSDETVMYFTSRRKGSTGNQKDGNGYFEDIYVSKKVDGVWTVAKNVRELNTKKHDAVISLSGDGKRMILYREGDLYITELHQDGYWQSAKKLPKTINSRYPETSASLSFHGDQLYFVSQNPKNSLGGLDIFVSKVDPEGKWGKPQNLGPTLNTPYDERSVFLLPDGKTMYFSSKGHNTIGGFDIFKTEFKNGKWSKPINLGVPINTPAHDVFLAVVTSEQHGYYSKISDEGLGEQDIYQITFLDAVPQAIATASSPKRLPAPKFSDRKKKAITSSFKVVKGVAKDQKLKTPIPNTLVEVWQNNRLIRTFKTDMEGAFTTVVRSGIPYQFLVKSVSHLPLKQDITYAHGATELQRETFWLQVSSTVQLATASSTHLNITPALTFSRYESNSKGNDWRVLKGNVLDKNTLHPLHATIEVRDRLSGDLISKVRTQHHTGKFLLVLPKQLAYTIVVRAENYLFYTDDFKILTEIAQQNILLQPLQKGEILTLNHIFFFRASDELTESSYRELDEVLKLLEENPQLQLEIRGHTDNQGDPLTLMRLSNARADRIMLYLINNGIAGYRLTARGYGGQLPVVNNDKEEMRKLNRRVEFKIIRTK